MVSANRNNCTRELTNKQFVLEDLALELFVSKRQLSRKIKTITGLTANRYIRTIRLHKAKTIFETEDVYTLKEVAYAVGYENTSHFAKQFEDQFGKRPHEYLVS
jgi:AraC-like DNA-binding protein